MVQTNPNQRKILQFAGLALIGGLLLATGGFIGNALADDSPARTPVPIEDNDGLAGALSDDKSGNESVNTSPPQSGIDQSGPSRPIYGTDGSGLGPNDVAVASRPEFYNNCPGTLGRVVVNGAIDPASSGFSPQFLSARFVLQSLSLRAEAVCDDPSQQYISFDTSWQTADGMFQTWVTQRQSNDPGANILHETWAEFWDGGYYYSVSVSQAYNIRTLATESDGDTTDAVQPLIAENTAELSALLADVITELSGDATLQCFYRQVPGGWDSLLGLGIGDPRGALPSGFTEVEVYAQAFEAPADCDVRADALLPIAFNASWTDGKDGWLSFNVYGVNQLYADELSIGRSNEYGISWSNGTFQYDLYGNRDQGGIGVDTLEVIARTVDPTFDQSCRLVEREFTQAELANVGIGWPVTPSGYQLTETRTSGSERSATCSPDVKEGYFSANWTFEGDTDGTLHASAWLDGTAIDSFREGGYMGVGHIGWQSANGVSYSVEAWTQAGEDGDHEAMIAIAMSLDPSIDIDSFSDGPSKVPPPIAPPAAEDTAGSSSGSSTDSR